MVSASQSLLKVAQPLVPRANKPITTADLIKRLTELSDQLIDASQDNAAIKTQLERSIAPQLVDKNLFNHKDKGVRSYVAVCVVEILRICAPDAPFNASQLKEIFELFIKQFKFLESSEQTYYANSVHLLKILEQTKCLVIINDMGNSSTALISSYFKTFFDLVRPSMNKDIEHLMTNILINLVDECGSLPTPVIETIVAQFTRRQPPKDKKKDQPDLTAFGSGGYPAAYFMAKSICQDCADHMSRDVATYFADVLVPDSSDDEEVDLEDLTKSHHLVHELYLASPHILSNTIPLLEAELQLENTDVRILAVECVGKMAGARISSANFTITYSSCWNIWLARRNDKSPAVRVKWLESIPDIFANNLEVVSDVAVKLNELLFSTEDKVRLAAVKVFGSLSYEFLLSHISKESLETLGARCKDRKGPVRVEAVHVLARMWHLAYTDLESEQPAAIEAFSWIPSALLSVVYTNDRDLTAALYREFYTVLVPLSTSNDVARTRRLLIFASQLDERAKTVFLTFPQRLVQYEPYFPAYIESAEKYNGGVVEDGESSEIEKKLDTFCGSIAFHLWGPGEVSVQHKADLKKWAIGNDRRGFRLLRDLIDPEKDFKSWRKSQKEVIQRVEEVSPALVPTFTSFIHLCTLTLWNKTTVEALVTALSDAETSSSARKTAHVLLKTLALSHPKLFKSVSGTLADWIISESSSISDNRSREDIETVEDVLKALARLPDLDFSGKQGKDFVQALKKFALEGESEREGRRATAVLLKLKRSNLHAEELVEAIVPSLSFESPHLVNRLGSLSKLMTLAVTFVEKHADDIVDTCIKDILLQCHDPEEGAKIWLEDADLGIECRAKILAMRILANRLRSNLDPETAETLAKPVLRLLGTLVQSGELRAEEDTPESTRARLRLCAGLIVIKLCTTRFERNTAVYEAMFTPKSFNLVGLLPQDDCVQVRHGFLEALQKALGKGALAQRWYTLCFLAAFEPNDAFKDKMIRWLKNRAEHYRANKHLVMEKTFPRLLHLLAHHTDFSTNANDLDDIVNYLTFYLDCVGMADNYALFFHLAQRVKQARDALEPDKSENLYVLSDLAQEIIKLRAQAQDWVLVTHPQKEKIPSELFTALPSQNVAQEIARKQFLPAEYAAELPMKLKRGTRAAPRKPKLLKPKTNVQPPKSPRSPPSPTTKKRPGPPAKKPAAPKKVKVERVFPGERRTSSRRKSEVKYTEAADTEDDEKMDVDNELTSDGASTEPED